MAHVHRNANLGRLAALGVALPYLAATLPLLIFQDRIGDIEYYRSGWLRSFDDLTSWLTLAAFLAGTAFGLPWLRRLFRGTPSKVRTLTLVIVGLLIHFLAVFVVRFLVYMQLGGIL